MRAVNPTPPPGPAGAPPAGPDPRPIDRKRVHVAALLAAKADSTDSLHEAIALTEKARTLLERALGAPAARLDPAARPEPAARLESSTSALRHRSERQRASAHAYARTAGGGDDDRGRLVDCRL